jgi:hypothetical protein
LQFVITPEIAKVKREEFEEKRDKNKLKFKLTRKKTTSKIPKELNNVVRLLKVLQSQELQTQIEISPK